MNQTAAKSMSGVSASVEKPTSSVAGHAREPSRHARERSPSTMVYVPRRRGGIKRLHSHGAQGRAQLVERGRGRGRRLPGVGRRGGEIGGAAGGGRGEGWGGCAGGSGVPFSFLKNRLRAPGARGRAQLVERVRGRGRRLPGVDRRERAAKELDGGHQARGQPAGDRRVERGKD